MIRQIFLMSIVAGACLFAEGKDEGLSKRDVKAIAERYIDTITTRDYSTWTSLMASSEIATKSEFLKFFEFKEVSSSTLTSDELFRPKISGEIKRIKIKRIKGVCIELEFQSKASYSPSKCLFIQPDGKIKYDAIFHQHPVLIARIAWGQWFHIQPFRTTGPACDWYYFNLKATGIPLQGFDRSSNKSKQYKALDKIGQWLEDEGEEWDSTYPKLFINGDFEKK